MFRRSGAAAPRAVGNLRLHPVWDANFTHLSDNTAGSSSCSPAFKAGLCYFLPPLEESRFYKINFMNALRRNDDPKRTYQHTLISCQKHRARDAENIFDAAEFVHQRIDLRGIVDFDTEIDRRGFVVTVRHGVNRMYVQFHFGGHGN